MSWLRDLLDRLEPDFVKGGRFEKLGAVYVAWPMVPAAIWRSRLVLAPPPEVRRNGANLS
jgi:hypothetical protein